MHMKQSCTEKWIKQQALPLGEAFEHMLFHNVNLGRGIMQHRQGLSQECMLVCTRSQAGARKRTGYCALQRRGCTPAMNGSLHKRLLFQHLCLVTSSLLAGICSCGSAVF